VDLSARAERPGGGAGRQHGHERDGVGPLPVLLLHPDEHLHGGLGEAVPRVAGDERVPGDAVPGGHPVEHPARVGGAAALGVHVGEGGGGERLGGEPPRGELGVDGAAGGEVGARRAELEERGEGAEDGARGGGGGGHGGEGGERGREVGARGRRPEARGRVGGMRGGGRRRREGGGGAAAQHRSDTVSNLSSISVA